MVVPAVLQNTRISYVCTVTHISMGTNMGPPVASGVAACNEKQLGGSLLHLPKGTFFSHNFSSPPPRLPVSMTIDILMWTRWPMD